MNGYQPFNPFGYNMPQVYQAPAAQQQVTRVNGENGAKAYSLGANSSALLLDESGLMVWLVTSDGAGYKTVSAYDIVPHKMQQAPDYAELEERIKKLEERMNGQTGNHAAAAPEQPGNDEH